MIEVEAILNSSPLTNVAGQPDNGEALIPNYFLIQRSYSSLPPGNFGEQKPTGFNKHVQQSMNYVWRRLTKEYLLRVIKRKKDRQQPASVEIRCCVVIQRIDAEKLEPWQRGGNSPLTRR